ncbi:hypothetical protein Taro_004129 [Colocasia esculenta]|uniref:Retrotransposon gag domain-containing protein n=1 Tax=Colocasia esculenta TaxID=4460 RepID=A0A843TQT3_COLES|nr:hypothetical protein [Colocasia esculenta]
MSVHLLYEVSGIECVPSVVRALRYRVPVSVVLTSTMAPRRRPREGVAEQATRQEAGDAPPPQQTQPLPQDAHSGIAPPPPPPQVAQGLDMTQFLEGMAQFVAQHRNAPIPQGGTGKFLGQPDPNAARAWLDAVERTFRSMECVSEERVLLASYQLQAQALTWWSSEWETTFQSRPLRQIPWQKFVVSFERAFCPTYVRTERLYQFLDLQQRDFTVVQYMARFVELGRYAPQIMADEGLRTQQFVRGLRPELSTMAPRRCPREGVAEQVTRQEAGDAPPPQQTQPLPQDAHSGIAPPPPPPEVAQGLDMTRFLEGMAQFVAQHRDAPVPQGGTGKVLRKFLQFQPPQFLGQPDPDAARAWLDAVEWTFRSMECVPEERGLRTQQFVRGLRPELRQALIVARVTDLDAAYQTAAALEVDTLLTRARSTEVQTHVVPSQPRQQQGSVQTTPRTVTSYASTSTGTTAKSGSRRKFRRDRRQAEQRQQTVGIFVLWCDVYLLSVFTFRTLVLLPVGLLFPSGSLFLRFTPLPFRWVFVHSRSRQV